MSWSGPHDLYLRRAARVTLVGFPLFAAFQLHRMPAAAASALFAVLSLGAYADFQGRPARRARRYLATGAVGLAMLELGTACAPHLAVALAATAAVGFVTILLGSLGGPFYLARFPVIVAFLFAVTSPVTPATVLELPIGWAIGVICTTVASLVLWPPPCDRPVRSLVAASCNRCAHHLRSRWLAEGRTGDHQLAELLNRLRKASGDEHLSAGAPAHDDRALSHAAHAVERLASHLLTDDDSPAIGADRPLVRSIADLLEGISAEVQAPGRSDDLLDDRLRTLCTESDAHRRGFEQTLAAAAGTPGAHELLEQQRSARLASAVRLTGELARTVGTLRPPRPDAPPSRGDEGEDRPGSAAAASLHPRSLWFREAVRYCVALSVAVYIAKGVMSDAHSFWIPLGTYSVLRGSLSTTTRTVSSTLVGTLIGFAVSSAVIALGTHRPWLLWAVVPAALFLAASAGRYRPEVGAASFTLVVVVLFSIIAPAGLSTGWIRLQDVVVGAAVSVVVAIVLWPRLGSGPRRDLARVVEDTAGNLVSGLRRWTGPPSRVGLVAPAGAAHRVCTELDRLLDSLGNEAPASVPTSARAALVAAVDEATMTARLLSGELLEPEASLVGTLETGIAADLAAAAEQDVAAATGALQALSARLVDERAPTPPAPSALRRLAEEHLVHAEPGRLPAEVAPALHLSIGLGRVHELAGRVPAIRFGQ